LLLISKKLKKKENFQVLHNHFSGSQSPLGQLISINLSSFKVEKGSVTDEIDVWWKRYSNVDFSCTEF